VGSSRGGNAPATADVRRTPRRGTRSRIRPKRVHPSQARVIVACPGRRVLRSVLRPAHVALTPHVTVKRRVVRRSFRHHGWANPRKWEEPALGPGGRTSCGSPRVTALAREAAWHVRKGRRSRPPSLRGNESSGFVGRTSCTLQKSPGDVWPRISSAYALQKGRSGSSERGPSSERGLAGQTVGRRIRRRDSRESASPLCRARIGARPRVARERHQRRRHRASGAAVAGPGS